MIFNRLVFFLALPFCFISCSNGAGELVGDGKGYSKWYSERPYGMNLIPGSVSVSGSYAQNSSSVSNSPPKTVNVNSFYMDDTEVTNTEYRQFVNWVKDSIVRTRLAMLAEELGGEEEGQKNKKGIFAYRFKNSDTTKLNAYQKYMIEAHPDVVSKRLNRDVDLIWETSRYPDASYAQVMDSIYLSSDQNHNGKRMIDVTQLTFVYLYFDLESAAKSKGEKRKKFILRDSVSVYPDTLVWIKDFAYSYNDPMHNNYFSHESFSDYPVVGVSWNQARAFCAWRTMNKNIYQNSIKRPFVNNFRLPTETEWEHAARGGITSALYPWGGPYIINERACYMANFKPLRNDYSVDGNLYTAEARSYQPNGYGLYNMSGNVSEWTDSSYFDNAYNYVSDINPSIGFRNQKRKVVKGGSWKDVSLFLQVGNRDYEYADTVRSYIGFRTIQDKLGKY